MKKIFLWIIFLLLISSCWITKNWSNIEEKKIKISSWETKIWNDISINSASGVVEVEEIKIDTNKNEEKDIVIIKDNNEDDDFEWKTQEEVVDEMWDYVNDLFNMIEEDVK